MLKLLSIKDTPTYWFKEMIGDALNQMGVTDFVIIDETMMDDRPIDRHCILVREETTYDKQAINQGPHSLYVTGYKIFTTRLYAKQDADATSNEDRIYCERVAATLNDYLVQPSHPKFYFQQMKRTSVPTMFGVDKNGNPIWDARYGAMFRKPKEVN